MAQQTKSVDKLLQRPLYVFDLPEELLYTLQLKTQTESESAPETPETLPTPPSPSLIGSEGQEEGHKAATSCTLCGLSFADLQEQRSHVRSDQHGYNIKQKLRGKPPVGETDFERLVGQLDESLSGSDTSESDEEDGEGPDGGKAKDSTLSALLKRQAKINDGNAEDAPTKKRQRGAGTAPMLWFSSPKLPSNTSLGVYRAIFSPDEQTTDHVVATIQRKQLAPKPQPQQPQQKKQKPTSEDDEDGGVKLPISTLPVPSTAPQGPHYFLCMIGGGHFAAMLVSCVPKLTKNNSLDRSATVLAHKTFHRYTTRRKQGGSQSANDSAKGAAHSAGAGIRRYNESALIQEVRDLLSEWRTWIASAELLFVRASGSSNRRTLFGPYEEQVLDSRDGRLRGFPFNTRRATQSELLKAFVELTRVKVEVVDEAALAREKEAAERVAKAKSDAVLAAANNKAAASSKAVKLSKEEEQAVLHTTQLQALIRRSKAPGLLSYLTSNGLTPDFRFFPAEQNHHAPTPLHLAAAEKSPACVSALLVKAGADPGVKSEEGKTAFEIAGDRGTRDSFRLARSQIGESRWAWDAANIPSALSQAEVDAHSTAEKAEKDAEDAAEKARRATETNRLRKEDDAKREGVKEKKFGKGRVLAAPTMTAEERRAQEGRGMTDEMRMKLERERRARAAEERMKKLQGK